MKKFLSVLFGIIGILSVLFGILFFLQGTGIFPYPKSSFMINETIWVIRGALLVVLGLVFFFIAGWLRPVVRQR
jgi:hypothetical protein